MTKWWEKYSKVLAGIHAINVLEWKKEFSFQIGETEVLKNFYSF